MAIGDPGCVLHEQGTAVCNRRALRKRPSLNPLLAADYEAETRGETRVRDWDGAITRPVRLHLSGGLRG